ncbi:sensor histidine kinase [Paenibacillus sp. 481]|uniref:sensor histidine kinase n=1 Tax=Paenibacillus sp. 481 TaxID=2835869 RepID=UPI001E607744|nr:sensor histidine kinase [Paenibacillus sp. 481]UHA72845.1 sensor histidine kinase [Paenibacillus sp. 481]
MNLRYKLFAGFVALIIIPLFLLGSITFFITFNLLEQKYSQQAEFSLRAIALNIEHVFNEIDNITDNGIGSNLFQVALSSPEPTSQDFTNMEDLNSSTKKIDPLETMFPPLEQKKSTVLTGSDYILHNEKQQNFRRLLFNHRSISFAYLYNFKKDAQSEYVSIFSKENFSPMPFKQFKEHHIYEEIVASKGKSKWLGPNEYPEITGNDQVFTQLRVVKNLNTMKNIGMSVIQIKNWDIEDIFDSFRSADPSGQHRFFLLNNNGQVLFDTYKQATGHNVKNYLDQPLVFKDGFHSFKGNFAGDESVVSMHKLDEFGWHLVSVRSWNSLSREMMVFIQWISVIMLLCILGAFLYNLLFMNRITRNITRIVRFMRRVEEGDLHARVVEEGNDELRLLSKGFNSLIDRVNGLLNQVKLEQEQKNKAEMRVLQAQIKPHFLFNTLESINVLAIQNEGRKVSQMVLRLGNILRISIQDKEEVTVRQELDYLRSYLEIQKFRFEELFNFEIDVPEEIMHCKIIKLTLQPLVENSIQHGFNGITHTGWIRISAHEDEERIFVTVEDNGLGMSNEQLKRFQYMLSDDQHSLVPLADEAYNTERRGLGVRSVADRIRIQYGSRYGLFICSAQNEGTIIQCTIPKYEQGEMYEREGASH